MSKEDIDLLIPHQANQRIIDSAAKRLKLSTDKIFVTWRNTPIRPAHPFPSPFARRGMQAGCIKVRTW